MEREPINVFPIFQGVSGTLYVAIGITPKGWDAIDLEKYAAHELVRVTIPHTGPVEPVDPKIVLPRFQNTYNKIIENFSTKKSE